MTSFNGAMLTNAYSALVWILVFHLFSNNEAKQDMGQEVYKVGETVFLHINENITVLETDDVQWKLNNVRRISKGQNIANDTSNKYTMFGNGTLQIHNGKKSDSGVYSVTVHTRSGLLKTNYRINLTFLEPVSDVLLVRRCANRENNTFTCSVGGGDNLTLHWMWTYNGSNQSLLLNVKEHTLSFWNVTPENLICEVFNEVSRSRKESPLCRGYLSTLTAIGIFLMTVLLMGIAGMIRKRKKNMINAVEDNIYLNMRGGLQFTRTQQDAENTALETSVYEFCRPQQIFQSATTPSTELPAEDENQHKIIEKA